MSSHYTAAICTFVNETTLTSVKIGECAWADIVALRTRPVFSMSGPGFGHIAIGGTCVDAKRRRAGRW
jgi:hypothetical protein